MKFLVDAQLPPALARWIDSQGHQATHVFEIGLERAKDRPIWEHALKENAVIITRFRRSLAVERSAGTADLDSKRQCSSRALLTWLEPLWPDAVKRLEQAEQFIELRA